MKKSISEYTSNLNQKKIVDEEELISLEKDPIIKSFNKITQVIRSPLVQIACCPIFVLIGVTFPISLLIGSILGEPLKIFPSTRKIDTYLDKSYHYKVLHGKRN
jgi:hypothetical protein